MFVSSIWYNQRVMIEQIFFNIMPLRIHLNFAYSINLRIQTHSEKSLGV